MKRLAPTPAGTAGDLWPCGRTVSGVPGTGRTARRPGTAPRGSASPRDGAAPPRRSPTTARRGARARARIICAGPVRHVTGARASRRVLGAPGSRFRPRPARPAPAGSRPAWTTDASSGFANRSQECQNRVLLPPHPDSEEVDLTLRSGGGERKPPRPKPVLRVNALEVY